MNKVIFVGYDPREHDAFMVTINSIKAHLSEDIPIFGIKLDVLLGRGLYQRPTDIRDGRLWDRISGAPMSTQFAISRFFIPHICNDDQEIALFMDCDMLVRVDLAELFEAFDPAFAVQVVKHQHRASDTIKMDNQIQSAYDRKNWSSVMLWNLKHPAHKALNLFKLNQWSGRALHQLAWLADAEIGELPSTWNHLVGVQPPDPQAKIVHFTLGIPRMPGYENSEHADEWRSFATA